jgi:serine protease Do
MDPFSQMFGQQGPQRVQQFRARASGSGFVFSRSGSSGLIVTNAHVVNPPRGTGTVSRIDIVFANGDRVPGHVYAANVGADLALVKVDNYSKIPPPVEIADSDKLQQGQWAIAIGEPFELQKTVTVGVVSGFNRTETIGNGEGSTMEFKGLLQTSAPINPGNSGGPLIDIDGRLIGVNQSTANPQAGAQGIGFAIPSNSVRRQVATLQTHPGMHQGTNMGFIGAGLVTVTPDIATQLSYSGKGVAVQQVVTGSAADQAGLQPGDVIQRANGQDVTSADQLTKIIQGTKPGSTMNFQVWSSGVKRLVNVKVQERPADIGVNQGQGQGQDQGGDQEQP